MSVRSRLRRWRRLNWRHIATRDTGSTLREFVYLDDVSVYSLMASRRGAIATEFTESLSATLQSDVSASAAAGMRGIASAEVSSRLQVAQAQRSQVLRKAIVQTTFKELFELEQENLLMRSSTAIHVDASVNNAQTIAWAATDQGKPSVIAANTLGRGGLVEVDVELSPEAVFRMSTVISEFVEMMQDSDELARAAGGAGEFDQAVQFARILDRLLVGLVPIRGRAVDFEVIEAGGVEYVVHRAVAERFIDDPEIQRRPLFVVGVAEEALFWKDIRRVLFSESRYRVLGRIGRGGVHPTWTPVKLVDVLKEIAPSLALQLTEVTGHLLAAAAGTVGELSTDDAARSMRASLVEYARLLAARQGHPLSKFEETVVEDAATQRSLLHVTFGDRVRAFREMTAVVEETCQIEVDREVATELRLERLLAGDSFVEDVAIQAELVQEGHDHANERYLDLEFVAIYW